MLARRGQYLGIQRRRKSDGILYRRLYGKNYQRLVWIAKSNNIICNFKEALNIDRGIIFRHDIDYSVHRAFALSEIGRNSEYLFRTFT